MAVAFTFPGQGSQAVGMGKALAEQFAEARAVFDEVDEALGEKLSATMFEGPEDVLTLTANAQPALMAVSMAVQRIMEARGFFAEGQGFLCRRSFAWRIFGSVRCWHVFTCRHGASLAHSRQCHAEGGSGRRRRYGGDHRSGTRRCGGCLHGSKGFRPGPDRQ